MALAAQCSGSQWLGNTGHAAAAQEQAAGLGLLQRLLRPGQKRAFYAEKLPGSDSRHTSFAK